jgi:S1-C subfamily serine protease
MDDIASQLSEATIDTTGIYQSARQAVVRISDGQSTIGTGFVYDADGHVVTPSHVVGDLAVVDVLLSDGTIVVADVIGTCEFSDIAVLSPHKAFTAEALTLVDSNMVKIGEPVAVIGNPFELPGTITSGIVSETDRFVEISDNLGSRWVANLIQLDAAVNFGNSGSPLLKLKGEVIGMVIGRIDPGLGDGIYYAVSSNKLKRVAGAIIAQGFFDYPWLGVGVTNITPETARARGLDNITGVLISSVLAAGAADIAGVEADDIMVSINGTIVHEVADLTSYLGEYVNVNDTVTLEIIRDGGKIELSARADKRF